VGLASQSAQIMVVFAHPMPAPLLEVNDLTTSFFTNHRTLPAIQNVSFSIQKASTVALVGESGCGKSVTALSILGLIQSPPGHIDGGKVVFNGQDLLRLDDRELRDIRGNRIAMIFQEPMTSLNPVFTVGTQVAEGLRLHRRVRRGPARKRALELLQAVGIPAPEMRLDAYPHQLSGGMRQRVMIAMALACSPDLLIADEPTTALDVTIQAQILELLGRLKHQFNMSVLLITHDLGIVAQHVDEVIVMYAGRVVETASVYDLFASPAHPYTAGLLASIPARAFGSTSQQIPNRLPTIEGVVPASGQPVQGCRFAQRCAHRLRHGSAAERCSHEEPLVRAIERRRSVRCHFPIEAPSGTN
jgi:peptide/nickel transport system ATP-binding protein